MLSLKATAFYTMTKQLYLFIFLFSTPLLLMAQDWPNLNYYREANSKLNLQENYEKRVVFMGNSITEGWSQHHPEFFKNKSFINRGISGQTTPQMLLRFKQDVVDLEPKLVVILAGTNDIAGNTGPSSIKMIVDNTEAMILIAKAHQINVILCSVLPAYDYPWRKGLNPNEKIPELNRQLKDVAKKNGVVFLDYFMAMTDGNNGLKKTYTYDGVHPNKNGYLVMESLVEKAIASVLE